MAFVTWGSRGIPLGIIEPKNRQVTLTFRGDKSRRLEGQAVTYTVKHTRQVSRE